MNARVASVLTLSAVALAHAAFLAIVFTASPPEPLAIVPPTVQGVLIPAAPAEVVQAPSAKKAPPVPEPAVVEPPPKPKPKPKPEPKPEAPKPKPKPEPPPVEAPPSERAITTPAEAAPEQQDAAPPANLSQAEEEADALGAPVVPPRVDASRLSNPAPAYPRQSRRMREEGTVMLELMILPDGTVGEIRVETSSGHSRLDESALEAVKRWRYVAATRGGKPIAYRYLQPIVFSLTN